MKNIGHIVVCDEVFNSPDGEVIIKKPLSLIALPSLPTFYTFVISIGLTNLVKDHTFHTTVKLISPTGKDVMVNTFEFKMTDGNGLPAGGYNVNCRNTLLEEEGDYEVSVTIGEDSKTLILPVIKRDVQ